MTLEVYNPERFDHLALRLLDAACDLREIAQLARENDLSTVQVHDKKALEFLARLEEWTSEALVRCQTATLKQRATRRAQGAPDERPADPFAKPSRKAASRAK